MRKTDEEVIQAYLEVAPPSYRRDFPKADHCIAATAIGIEVLDYFGIPSEPLPVGLRIQNEYAKNYFDRTKKLLSLDDKDYPVHISEGYHLLSVGFDGSPKSPNAYDGHLVLATSQYLVDALLGEYSRPIKHMYLEASMFEVPSPGDDVVGYDMAGGSRVIYVLNQSDQSFRKAPDWKLRKKRFAILVGALIRAVKERLEESNEKTI